MHPRVPSLLVEFSIDDATPADRTLVARMLQLYLHDFSEFAGYEAGPDGLFEYAWLDSYWVDSDRHAVVFRVDGRPAGFAFVRDLDVTVMAEFFVMRGFRRGGLGREAARRLFARWPGPWRLTQLPTNPGATRFWESTIPVPFERRVESDGTVEHRFTVAAT